MHDEHIQEYQVKQTKNGADISVLTNGPLDQQKVIDGIVSELKKLGFSEPQVSLQEVTKFEYPETRKLRRFIPLKLQQHDKS